MDLKYRMSLGRARQLAKNSKQDVVVLKTKQAYRVTLKSFVKHNQYEAIVARDLTIKDKNGKIIDLDKLEKKEKTAVKNPVVKKEAESIKDKERKQKD